MPITLTCTCGKSLRVADQAVGKQVKCPACGAAQTVRQPVAKQAAAAKPAEEKAEYDDFEIIEETATPAAKATVPARPKIRAVAAEEPASEASALPSDSPPAKRKKKKKKKKLEEDEEDDWYEKSLENQARMKRVVRAVAFIVLGVLIVGGVAFIYFNYRDDVNWVGKDDPRVKIGLIVFAIMGLLAIGKGIIGLALGQFLGEDD